jgi:hypothetical protein
MIESLAAVDLKMHLSNPIQNRPRLSKLDGSRELPMGVIIVIMVLPILDFSGMGGSSYVKPLVLPVAFVVLMLRMLSDPAYFKLPNDRATKTVIAFVSWALISTLIGRAFIDLPLEIKGFTLIGRTLRDFFSLLTGAIFWIFIRKEVSNSVRALRAVRWLIISFFIILPFSLIQIGRVTSDIQIFESIDGVLGVLRNQNQIPYQKIFGFAPEGSMLADQLISIYISFCVALNIHNVTLFKTRILSLRVETVVLIASLVQLVFTKSRIGFASFVVVCVAIVVVKNNDRKAAVSSLKILIMLIAAVILGVAGLYISNMDLLMNFIKSFSGAETSIENGNWSNITRMGCNIAGINTGFKYPFGVGVGGFPFVFNETVPEWALESPEVRALIGSDYSALRNNSGGFIGDIEDRLVDAKALLPRVFSELGLIGLIIAIHGWFSQIRSLASRMSIKGSISGLGQSDKHDAVLLGCTFSLISMLPLSVSIGSYVWVHWLFISAVSASVCNWSRQNK